MASRWRVSCFSLARSFLRATSHSSRETTFGLSTVRVDIFIAPFHLCLEWFLLCGHALAVDVADLETSEFASSHAGGVERHQQGPSKQCSSRINQARNFFPAQHRRQPTPVLRVRQELAELMSLERLSDKESQRRYSVDHRAGRQLALGQ